MSKVLPGGEGARHDMLLRTHEDINPKLLSRIREAREETLEKFWSRLGYSKSAGHRYESGDRKLPDSLKQLVWKYFFEPQSLSGEAAAEDRRLIAFLASEPELRNFILRVAEDRLRLRHLDAELVVSPDSAKE